MRPHRSHGPYRFPILSLGVAAVALAAGCSSSGGTTSGGGGSSGGSKSPLVIGASLSLTGDFSADGQAYQKGYDFWAAEVNAAGGILGRKVQMKILNDNSSPSQVVTNYQTLISSDHVDLVFGPFSTLLTVPSSAVASRYGYAMWKGRAAAPRCSAEADNVFDPSLPMANELVCSRLDGVAAGRTAAHHRGLPDGQRPVRQSQVQRTSVSCSRWDQDRVLEGVPGGEGGLQGPRGLRGGVQGSGGRAGLDRRPDRVRLHVRLRAAALQPEDLGRLGRPGPGRSFPRRSGRTNANGMMVPDGWYPGCTNKLSQAMVKAYVAKYGGTASDINADVAEAYSVGRGRGAGGHRTRRHRQRQDHQLPAQRRHRCRRCRAR